MNAISTFPLQSTRVTIVARAAQEPAKIFRPVIGAGVAAGFASPADEFLELDLDLNDLLVRNRDSTFYMRVRGSSMAGAGIFDKALLVVDRSRTPVSGDVVVAIVNGGFVVKQLRTTSRSAQLLSVPANAPPSAAAEAHDGFEIWGVVTATISQMRGR